MCIFYRCQYIMNYLEFDCFRTGLFGTASSSVPTNLRKRWSLLIGADFLRSGKDTRPSFYLSTYRTPSATYIRIPSRLTE